MSFLPPVPFRVLVIATTLCSLWTARSAWAQPAVAGAAGEAASSVAAPPAGEPELAPADATAEVTTSADAPEQDTAAAAAPSVESAEVPEQAAVPEEAGQAPAAAGQTPPVTSAARAHAAPASPSVAGYPLTAGISSEPLADQFVLGGYLQAQFESHQDSLDQQRQGGGLINADRFSLRRARLKVSRDWQFAQVVLEVDGNTTRGPAIRVQKAEVSLIYGRSKDKEQPPLAQLTLGQFDLPFGFELVYGSKYRWFTERSTASRALFPGEPDLGVRLSGGIGFARYAIAVTNGEPSDEKNGFALQDPNANKDVSARLGAEAHPTSWLALGGGVSANSGRGFHPSADVTKNAIGWKDMNENGRIDGLVEVVGSPAMVGMPAQNFSRWAVGADLQLLLRTTLGWTMVYGELVAASNLDRGLFVADPVLNKGSALREFGYYVAFTQELTRHALVGFRYDAYDPNADFLDKRAGRLLPTSQVIRTFSPLIALALPGYARLVFQWDIVRDSLARNARGVPTDLKNDQWTLRLQVSL